MTTLSFDDDMNLIDETNTISYLAETMQDEMQAQLIMKAYNEFGATSYMTALNLIPELAIYRQPLTIKVDIEGVMPGTPEFDMIEQIKSKLDAMGQELETLDTHMTYQIQFGSRLVDKK